MTARWVLAVRWVAVVAVCGYALLSLLLGRSLAGLGSWTFVDSLTSGGFWAGDPYRVVGTHVAQAPLALALQSGVTDLGMLRLAHGVGYVLIAAVMWAIALILLIRSRAFEFVLLGYAATALTCDYIAVADVNLLFAATALLFAITVRYFTVGGRALPWVAFVVSWIAAFTHGFALLLAPLLIAVIVVLRSRFPRTDTARLPWLLTIAVLALGTVVSGMSVLWPYSPANVVAATDPSAPLANPQLLFLAAWLLVLPIAILPTSRIVRAVATVALASALAWFVLDPALWPTPAERHGSRSASAVLLLAILCLALVTIARGQRRSAPASPRPASVVLPLALVLALLVPLATQAVSFSRYLTEFQAAITGRDGLIAYRDFVTEVPDVATFELPYSPPTMSLILGIGRRHAIVEPPTDSIYIQPFDLANPPDLGGRFTGSVAGG